MSDPHSSAQAKTVVFFDHCTPRLEACHIGCETDKATKCKHRLKFSTDIWNSDKRMGFLGYSDHQVVLFFLFLIKERFRAGTWKDIRFIIAAKDENFLKDAKSEHAKPRQNKDWKKPRLEFFENLVIAEGIPIHFIYTDCSQCVKKGQPPVRCVIGQLNHFWTQLEKNKK